MHAFLNVNELFKKLTITVDAQDVSLLLFSKLQVSWKGWHSFEFLDLDICNCFTNALHFKRLSQINTTPHLMFWALTYPLRWNQTLPMNNVRFWVKNPSYTVCKSSYKKVFLSHNCYLNYFNLCYFIHLYCRCKLLVAIHVVILEMHTC
jgi:hypothetical protein